MAASNNNGKLSAVELGRAAMRTVEELTGYTAEAVTALEGGGEFWEISVDALELSRIPDTTDVLGEYIVRLDEDGNLRGYHRQRRFQRCAAEGH